MFGTAKVVAAVCLQYTNNYIMMIVAAFTDAAEFYDCFMICCESVPDLLEKNSFNYPNCCGLHLTIGYNNVTTCRGWD